MKSLSGIQFARCPAGGGVEAGSRSWPWSRIPPAPPACRWGGIHPVAAELPSAGRCRSSTMSTAVCADPVQRVSTESSAPQICAMAHAAAPYMPTTITKIRLFALLSASLVVSPGPYTWRSRSIFSSFPRSGALHPRRTPPPGKPAVSRISGAGNQARVYSGTFARCRSGVVLRLSLPCHS